ncbi:hypothetical protein N9934_00030 [Desulfosarcina sp.]|nr:hypothetical protein [Desulfosarcina sp.]
MNIKSIILFLLIITFGYNLNAQEIGIGEWRDHLPYRTGVSVAPGDNKVYCAAEQSLFYYIPEDNSVNKLSRVQGLSDIGIAKIGYTKEYKTLVIAYSNTNIDLIKGNAIINKSDILNSSAITPEESVINNLMFIDKYAYLSCGFGIVVLDVQKEEITDTYYIGPNGSHLQVFDLTVNDTSFFAATEEGIYHARKDDPNLAYFGAWTKDETVPHPDEAYNHIAINAGVIYVNKFMPGWAGDTIIYFQDNEWKYNNEIFLGSDVYSLDVYNDLLYISYSSLIKMINPDATQNGVIWSYYQTSPRPREIIFYNAEMWIADNQNGLVRRSNDAAYNFIYPNGPYSSDVYSMSSQGGEVWVAPGGKDLSWQNLWKPAQLFIMNDGFWNTLDNSSGTNPSMDTIRDIITVEINPQNTKQVFAGTWYKGLIEVVENTVKNVYDANNSSLQNIGSACRVGGVKFDASGNLWATNSNVNDILSVRMNDGTDLGKWRSFYLGSSTVGKEAGELVIDQIGQKWIIMRPTQYITVFNDNATPDDPSDDFPAKQLSSASGNGAIPGSGVFSLAVDNDGEIWVGTDEGLAVFYSPENVYENYNFDAQRILIPRNDGTGLADILLEFEVITAIAVDGANNKWVGTENSGVYMFSPDGLTEIQHFTMDNSPLLSNSITSITINNKNGEVFFGTANGVISYKSTATEGGTTNEDVYAYPNPVRPGYSGPIAIKGLVNDADFKITDINGSLVYSGTAEGGQAIWDGKTFNGRIVQTGVYMVFVTDKEGSETLVTKILFMN